MQIGYLDPFNRLDVDGTVIELSRHSAARRLFVERFWTIGESLGITFRWIDQLLPSRLGAADIQQFVDQRRRLIEECDGFIAHGPLDLLDDRDAQARLLARIRAGAPLIVHPSINNRERQNALLAHFELVVTDIRMCNPGAANADFRIVRLPRSEDCFRHPELFRGVEAVTLFYPLSVWYAGEAQPLLVGTSQQISIDLGDIPCNWNGRELACIAGHYPAHGGLVLVVPLSLVTEVPGEPGIEENQQFASNLLMHLLQNSGSRSARSTPTGDDLCGRIERNLGDFVLEVLRASSATWWNDCIPLPIRQKCAQRQEEEKGRISQKEAYLDLTDMYTLLDKNWQKFETFFRKMGYKSKPDSLSWIPKLNEYRRMTAHPIKRQVSGFEFGSDDLNLLREWDAMALKLRDLARAGAA